MFRIHFRPSQASVGSGTNVFIAIPCSTKDDRRNLVCIHLGRHGEGWADVGVRHPMPIFSYVPLYQNVIDHDRDGGEAVGHISVM